MQFLVSIVCCLLTITSLRANNFSKPARMGIPKDIWIVNSDFSTQQEFIDASINTIFQPYFSQGISYYTKSNFDFSLLGGLAVNSDTSNTKTAYDLIVSTGYTYMINPAISIRPSYSHFEYSNNSHAFQSIFTDMFQFDFYLQKQKYYSGLYTSYLFGEKDMLFVSLKNGVLWSFENFLAKNSLLNISVDIDINFSDKNYYNTILYESWTGVEFAEWIDEHFPLYPVYRRIVLYGLEATKNHAFERLNELDPDLFKHHYTINSIYVSLPLSYSIKKIYAYLSPMLAIPTTSNIFYSQNLQFIFSAGISYSF